MKLVRVTWGRRKRYRVHVAFTEPCDEEFYSAALHPPGSRGAGEPGGASASGTVTKTS